MGSSTNKIVHKLISMDLFNNPQSAAINILPNDGMVNYYGKVFTTAEATACFNNLLHNIHWVNDEALLFGKLIITKRKAAWYGDRDFKYSYSNRTKVALPWTEHLLEIKKRIELITGESFNSCLLNLYHNGSEGMAWHSDAEKDLKKNGAIASLSLGAARKFAFRHKKTKETVSLILEHGSLLVMKGETQTHWLHRLPPTKTKLRERINLTFRTITEQSL